MIFENSRYATAEIDPIADADGVYHATVIVPLGTPVAASDFISYTVVQGDTLSSIAADVYGDPELWWLIADSNITTLFYPDELTPGLKLEVPSVATLR